MDNNKQKKEVKWGESDDEESFDAKGNQFGGLDKPSKKNYEKYVVDSDDEDEKERKVKTPYQKAEEIIINLFRDLDSVNKTEFSEAIIIYKDAIKSYEKNIKLYDQKLTNQFLKTLLRIIQRVNSIDKKAEKELSKVNFKGYNELKKLIKDNKSTYGEMLENFEKNLNGVDLNLEDNDEKSKEKNQDDV
jgi:hypothetical protein